MRVLPLAGGSDFYLHDYLIQGTPKGRDKNGHHCGGVELGDPCQKKEPIEKAGKGTVKWQVQTAMLQHYRERQLREQK